MAFEKDLGQAPRRSVGDGSAKSRIIQSLTEKLGVHVVEMWFDDGHSILVENRIVRISGANDFQLGRIRTRFGEALRQAVEQSCGAGIELVYVLTGKESEAQASKPVPSIHQMTMPNNATRQFAPADSELSKESPSQQLRKRHRGVDSFWFGETNRVVEAGVRQVFEQIGEISPLVVYGPTGSGKTHLLESIVFDARRKKKLRRCIYLSAEQFTANFVDALRGTGLPLFRRKYRDLDVLAIDDVQFFGGKNATLAEFQYTVDHLVRNGKQVVLSSDRSPVELGQLGTEVAARMVSGLVCPLNYPDAVGRSRIVREICRQRNFDVSPEIQDLISHNLARDVRRLSGALNRVNALSKAYDGEVSVDLAKQVLTDLFSISGTLTSIDKIEQVVCEFCGVKPTDLKSSSRQKKISSARMLAMYLSRQHTPKACSEIGDYFGGRSHSTVIAAEKKVAQWLENNLAIDLPNARYPAKDAVIRIESNLRVG